MKAKNIFISLILMFIISPFVLAIDKQKENHELIISVADAGLFAGRCSTFSKMHEFQKENKIPNGDEFIDKFITSEASSGGSNIKEYTEVCIESINAINELKKTKQQGE